MRIAEALQLRVKDIELDRLTIIVREGKGGKDRAVMLPQAHVLKVGGGAVTSPLDALK